MITAQENFTAWLTAEIQAANDDPRPSIPHEEVMARMDAQIARLKEGRPVNHRAIFASAQHQSLPIVLMLS